MRIIVFVYVVLSVSLSWAGSLSSDLLVGKKTEQGMEFKRCTPSRSLCESLEHFSVKDVRRLREHMVSAPFSDFSFLNSAEEQAIRDNQTLVQTSSKLLLVVAGLGGVLAATNPEARGLATHYMREAVWKVSGKNFFLHQLKLVTTVLLVAPAVISTGLSVYAKFIKPAPTPEQQKEYFREQAVEALDDVLGEIKLLSESNAGERVISVPLWFWLEFAESDLALR